MIAFLIIFLVFIVILAFFIGYNLTNLCSFWLFHTYTQVPVLVLVFFSFALGIVFSILIMIVAKLLKMKKNTKEKSEPVVKEEKKADNSDNE